MAITIQDAYKLAKEFSPVCQSTDDRFPLTQTLEKLRSDLGETQVDALHAILRINEQRGRFCRYLRLNPQETAESYIAQLIAHFKNDHHYLDQVQRQKNSDIWEPLIEKIRQWSYRFLGRWHLDEAVRINYTDEIAQEAGLQIINAHYPYDCEFDAWACKITHHVSSKYMKRHGSSAVLSEVNLSDVAEWFQGSGESLAPNLEDQFATRQFLLNAIDQLSENQKVVIWQFYFEGRSLPQIAEKLDINVNTIYKRHFDALKQLRKIIGVNQYKDEYRYIESTSA